MPGLLSSLHACKKNPGHASFTSITEFNQSNLPPNYKDSDIVSLIRAQSDLTFQLSSTYVSMDRPKMGYNEDKPFPFYDKRGQSDVIISGCGWVEKVVKFTEVDEKFCPCDCCKVSEHPEKSWGEIWLRTAKHIVFDTSEAKQTTCNLFYDTIYTDHDKIVSLSGMEVIDSDYQGNWCQMKHVTHDLALVERLDKMCRSYNDLRDKVREKFKDDLDEMKLAAIVSHPHGISKQVSVGEWIDRYAMEGRPDLYKYTYNTPTCPGVGGARVYIFGKGKDGFDHAHEGCLDSGKNVSNFGLEL